ncbi:MAG: Imm50 family immunity protein [Aeromonadaceae bacterium]
MKRVFSKPPKIGVIGLFDIEIKRDGPTVNVNFDLVDVLPDKVPMKWGTQFNRCSAGIYCLGVSNLIPSGTSTNLLANIYFNLSNKAKEVVISNSSFNINFAYKHISLTGPSVYFSQQ